MICSKDMAAKDRSWSCPEQSTQNQIIATLKLRYPQSAYRSDHQNSNSSNIVWLFPCPGVRISHVSKPGRRHCIEFGYLASISSRQYGRARSVLGEVPNLHWITVSEHRDFFFPPMIPERQFALPIRDQVKESITKVYRQPFARACRTCLYWRCRGQKGKSDRRGVHCPLQLPSIKAPITQHKSRCWSIQRKWSWAIPSRRNISPSALPGEEEPIIADDTKRSGVHAQCTLYRMDNHTDLFKRSWLQEHQNYNEKFIKWPNSAKGTSSLHSLCWWSMGSPIWSLTAGKGLKCLSQGWRLQRL